MGFFQVELTKNVRVHPRHFHSKLKETLIQTLMDEVEGTVSGRFGFVVSVLEVLQPLPKGILREGFGFAVYPLKYKALVFRPFKGEVLDAVVTNVTRHGIFAQVGPLTIFVSRHQIPSDMTHDEETASYISVVEKAERIQRDSAIRLRVNGIKIDASSFTAVGTILDDYLGLIE
ncbi:DNA-directed RNA polymerase II subunit RPB7 [Galdieria sulphuraria]|uniref:DNA-directed RNA polymerase II subunit G n=1 Tax=Galdieria sulphuraria TaxID=130081 RepID=M2WSF9_GALSU|nr:DNA-directed RNA polymerase II subunit G [Galdieria sulphuraria]EME26790.1 DNA-directed RNA polymerase II subunit G [Galdieria sulphuraria]GJD11273.1 DNA-directed RNA polymerase II subunit RPB7 [Galdieria sulphuraria]|eukprot:XP_005703310.1 DNA-directed RNA polymerase II subunit G [Galdieria sulphuraria]